MLYYNKEEIYHISQCVRGRSVMEGMQMEAMTIDEWLEYIERLM